ncbi:MAG: hypothetical protein R3C61_28490 [Bacteroidia bacterium]
MNGNHYSFGDCGYDSRTGRRWNVDPIFKEYESPYATFGNSPIWLLDVTGHDTLIVHKKNLYTKEGVVVSLITFSILQNNIETALPNIMYSGANASYIQLKENEDYNLTYDVLMEKYHKWKNLSIFVNYPGKKIFFHPNGFPEGNTGCLTLSEEKPYAGTYKGEKTMFFQKTTDALIKVRSIYEMYELQLTGDKFLIRTNSEAKTTPPKPIPPIIRIDAKKMPVNAISPELSPSLPEPDSTKSNNSNRRN